MNILVQEKPIALRSSYNITTPNGALTAVKAWMPIPPKLTLNTPDGGLVAEMKGPFFAFLKPTWTITFPDARSYAFKCEKIIKATYTCISTTGETYTLYTHRSLKFSIYKGETQVAAFTRNRVSIASGHTYNVEANSDVDVPLIISMILTFNTLTADKEKGSTIAIGHLGPIDKEQDTTWQPS